jgi:hypothetical protein
VRIRTSTGNGVATNVGKREDADRANSGPPQIVDDILAVFDFADEKSPARFHETRRDGAVEVRVDHPARGQDRRSCPKELEEKRSARIPVRYLEHEKQG